MESSNSSTLISTLKIASQLNNIIAAETSEIRAERDALRKEVQVLKQQMIVAMWEKEKIVNYWKTLSHDYLSIYNKAYGSNSKTLSTSASSPSTEKKENPKSNYLFQIEHVRSALMNTDDSNRGVAIQPPPLPPPLPLPLLPRPLLTPAICHTNIDLSANNSTQLKKESSVPLPFFAISKANPNGNSNVNNTTAHTTTVVATATAAAAATVAAMSGTVSGTVVVPNTAEIGSHPTQKCGDYRSDSNSNRSEYSDDRSRYSDDNSYYSDDDGSYDSRDDGSDSRSYDSDESAINDWTEFKLKKLRKYVSKYGNEWQYIAQRMHRYMPSINAQQCTEKWNEIITYNATPTTTTTTTTANATTTTATTPVTTPPTTTALATSTIVAIPSTERKKHRPITDRYKCNVCQKKYASSQSLNIHAYSHSGRFPFKCQYCTKGFGHKGNFTKHLRTHSGEKPFECDLCGKKFSVKESLNSHMLSHSGKKPYNCLFDGCEKSFARSHHRSRHIRTVHRKNIKPHKCDQCGKAFTERYELTKHMRTHNNLMQYFCRTCNQGFVKMVTRNRHEMTHNALVTPDTTTNASVTATTTTTDANSIKNE